MSLFTDKFFNDVFRPIYNIDWLPTIFYFMIDRNRAKQVRLDRFLSAQLEVPSTRLLEVAETLRDKDKNKTLLNILTYVYKNVKYEPDYNNWGNIEYWANAEETLKRGKDDCDGQNALIYILARLAGISSFELFCCIGDAYNKNTKETLGHFWLIYLDAHNSTSTNFKFYSLDACWYPDFTEIESRQQYDITIYPNIWFVFNEDFIYKHR